MSDMTSVRAVPAVDYLTVTTKDRPQSDSLVLSAVSLLDKEAVKDSPRRQWMFKGYRGFAVEGMRCGVRGDEAIVMLSGGFCNRLWRTIGLKSQKCTRIDLAVTVELLYQDLEVAKRAFESASLEYSGNCSTILNSRGGTTTYVGSRASMYMGRLYDKGAEEGLASGLIWRYEVEIKKPASSEVLKRLISQDDVSSWIGEYVKQWFVSRGVECEWPSSGQYNAIEITTTITTLEKSLEWLRTQVRPTVQRLLIAGMEMEIRDALALPEKINKITWD